jgi:hypothetical protein
MITIISDFNRLLSPGNQTIIEMVADYPGAYQKILTMLQNQQDHIITVHHPTILQWFKNMASRYPQDTFVFKTIDARGALELRMGMEIPMSVTNDDILQAGLLSLDLQPQLGFSFEDTLLAHYFAPILTSMSRNLYFSRGIIKCFRGSYLVFQRKLFERISQIYAGRLLKIRCPGTGKCLTRSSEWGGKVGKHITYSGSIPYDRKLLIQAGQS